MICTKCHKDYSVFIDEDAIFCIIFWGMCRKCKTKEIEEDE